MRLRQRTWVGIAGVAALVAGGGSAAVISGRTVAPPAALAQSTDGDLSAWFAAHCQAVAAQKAATSNRAVKAALQDEQDATGIYLGGVCPTTTVPATTTSTSAETTTSSTGTTTSSVPSTTTTTIPTSTTSLPPVAGCGIQTATATIAFCDTFGSSAGANPASRSGDLNAQIWGVSRTNSLSNGGQGQFNPWYAATLVGCGADRAVFAPRDVQICNGTLLDAVSDHGGQITLAMYPKQPFDIAGGRTGTVGFDVSDDSLGTHAAWPEWWWTDQPVPAPAGSDIPVQEAAARNSLGVSFAAQCGSNGVTVDAIYVTRNHVPSSLPFTGGGCVSKGSIAAGLNHVEIRVSTSQVQVFMSDAGSSTLVLVATAANAGLTLTRGVEWIEEVHYNACKVSAQCDHTFAWDNVGFDGPAPYRDLSFDVPDNGSTDGADLGWQVRTDPVAVHTLPVFTLQDPTSVLVTFNAQILSWPPNGEIPQVRVNGGPWHNAPDGSGSDGIRTFAIPVPLAEVDVSDVSNVIEFRTGGSQQVVSNVNLILIAGSPVT